MAFAWSSSLEPFIPSRSAFASSSDVTNFFALYSSTFLRFRSNALRSRSFWSFCLRFSYSSANYFSACLSCFTSLCFSSFSLYCSKYFACFIDLAYYAWSFSSSFCRSTSSCTISSWSFRSRYSSSFSSYLKRLAASFSSFLRRFSSISYSVVRVTLPVVVETKLFRSRTRTWT